MSGAPPAKPPPPFGTRRTDPNRNKPIDILPEGAENDADYQKLRQDIEAMQQGQGWLFGRGAFDKGDIMYLRDQAEQERHKELDLRDEEQREFELLRAKIEQEEAKQAAASKAAALKKTNPITRPTQVLRVAIKQPGKPAEKSTTPTEPATKRAKLSEDHPAANADEAQPGTKQVGFDSPSPAQRQPASKPVRSRSSSKGQAGGLGALLGDYSSSDDDADSSRKPDRPKQGDGAGPSGSGQQAGPSRLGTAQKPAAVKLPSAAELFGLQQEDLDSGEADPAAGQGQGDDAGAEESGGSISADDD